MPIPGLEFGLFALGHKRYADLFEDETDGQVRAALLDAHILMTEAKHFKNLHLQESRLRRQYRQDAQELAERQRQRQQEQEEKQEQVPRAHHPQKENGFEFTKAVATLGREAEKGTDHYQSSSSTMFRAGSV
jgi:hypothetical protein